MPVPAIIGVVSLVAQGVGMAQQNKANNASANLATSTAAYNARVDRAQEAQIEEDSTANTRLAREQEAIYTSRQRTAYAASGVLNTGSALAVQVETRARMEQQTLQDHSNAMREAARQESAAQQGIAYGAAQASAIRTNNSISMLKGGVNMLSSAEGLYKSGAFTSTPAPTDSRDSMLSSGWSSANNGD